MATPFTGSVYTGWEQISIAIAALSIIASAMLIVFSRMFSLKTLEQTAKAEFVFAISTVLIVFVSLAIIETGEQAFADPADGVARTVYLATFGCSAEAPVVLTKPNPEPWTAIDYIDLYMGPPRDCAIKTMDTLYLLAIPVEACASVYTEVFMSEVASGYGCKPISERIKNSTSMLTFYLYIYYIFFYVLKFIKYFAGLFFSIGVVLRAFPPTRGAGAYVMAAAIGFYLIFPISYIIFATISLPHAWDATSLTKWSGDQYLASGQMPYCTQDQVTAHFDELCALPDLADLEYAGCGSGDKRWTDSMINIIRANKGAIDSFLGQDSNLPSITNILDIGNRMINTVCIAPLVAMIVTMTFVLNSTNLFGGNIPEIGRGLVKLI